jgi:hypothetical protein
VSTESPWKKLNDRDLGSHYTVWSLDRGADGLAALRETFPDGEANRFNFVLFSTSGVHGTYRTIEDAEEEIRLGIDEDERCGVTFLVIHPRTVVTKYGNCQPRTAEDIAFLKTLRASSRRVLAEIGGPDDEKE